MRTFLEQYGVGLFVLICISILIPFASPLGNTIKNVENIENDALTDTKTYTIIFNWNGATSGSMDQMAVVCGKEIKLPKATFQKDGADFTRWNTKSDGTGFSIYTSFSLIFHIHEMNANTNDQDCPKPTILLDSYNHEMHYRPKIVLCLAV